MLMTESANMTVGQVYFFGLSIAVGTFIVTTLLQKISKGE